DRLTIDGLINGLPGESIGINAHIDDACRQLLATGCDAREIDCPFLAVTGPEAVAKPPIGLEDPRTNTALRIVLAEHLRPGLADLASFFDRKFSANVRLGLVPLVSRCHFPILAGHVPGSDEPFEILQAVIQAIVTIPFLDKGHLPLAVVPNQEGVAPA